MTKIDAALKANADGITALATALKYLGNVISKDSKFLEPGYGYFNGPEAITNGYPTQYGTILVLGGSPYISQTVWETTGALRFFVRTSTNWGSTWTDWAEK